MGKLTIAPQDLSIICGSHQKLIKNIDGDLDYQTSVATYQCKEYQIKIQETNFEIYSYASWFLVLLILAVTLSLTFSK